MLKLFAAEEHPGAEKGIRLVGLKHRVKQKVELETEGQVVGGSTHSVPRVPRFYHQSRDFHGARLVDHENRASLAQALVRCLLNFHQLHTVSEEC